MIKANIMPIFNTDMAILLNYAHLFDFLMFFDQKTRAVKKKNMFL